MSVDDVTARLAMPGLRERRGPGGVHLVEAGEPGSRPTFLLHGIGGSARTFTGQLDELAIDHHLLAWDAPGYRHSEDPAAGLDLDGLADLAAECIREVFGADLGAHVLGMSWGGVIATRVALRHPELVRSLMLGDSTVGSGTSAATAEAMRSRIDDLRTRGAEEFAATRAPRLVSEDAPPEVRDRAIEIMAEAVRPSGYSVAAESMAATDHTDDLDRITAPTLVFWGDADVVTGRTASIPLVGKIPGAVGVEVRGAGHLANQEAPDRVNQWIASFTTITERMATQNPWQRRSPPTPPSPVAVPRPTAT